MEQLNSFEPLQEVGISTNDMCTFYQPLTHSIFPGDFFSGTGAYKLGANYAPGVMPQKMAAKEGYAQNLWLHGPDHHLTEVGTMNLFVAFKRGDSKDRVHSRGLCTG